MSQSPRSCKRSVDKPTPALGLQSSAWIPIVGHPASREPVPKNDLSNGNRKPTQWIQTLLPLATLAFDCLSEAHPFMGLDPLTWCFHPLLWLNEESFSHTRSPCPHSLGWRELGCESRQHPGSTTLAVQWLGFCASNAGEQGFNPWSGN